ncbi:MAG: hypothetical protein AAGJ93_01415, partial [Bacteroidota bacterium]
MKKLIFSFLAFVLIASSVQAQEDPGRAVKKAGTALKAFELDQTANLDKLHEAVDLISIGAADDEVGGEVLTLQTLGDVMNAVANQIVNIRYTKIGSVEELPQVENPSLRSLRAYEQALAKATKKFHFKDALTGIRAVQGTLNNLGIYAYEDGSFDVAFKNFNGVITAHNILLENKKETMLDSDESISEQ